MSRRRGDERVNLALLTDGLRAEREQGITIDVAYRYFATQAPQVHHRATRPGHIQYTRNMVTGASTANLAIVLVDARQGVVEQSAPPRVHRVAAAHPAPRVRGQQDGPRRLERGARSARSRPSSATSRRSSTSQDIAFIPMSALTGANVVERSAEHALVPRARRCSITSRRVHIASDRNLIDVRFPVQWVIRPQSDEHHDYRGYAGQVAGGVLRPGDEVIVLPSGPARRRSRGSRKAAAPIEAAFAPMSVTIHLADDVDVGRAAT